MPTLAVAVASVVCLLAAPHAEDVTIPGGAEGVELAGTLVLPEGEGPHPVVVLISGSGPQDRDETLFGLKPFRTLAEGLAERGIGSLRYDDRGTAGLGVGKSTGDFRAATTDDFAADARAVVGWLREHEGVDAERVAVLGHSEGAAVAAQLGAGENAPAAIVLLAGPGLSGLETMVDQYRALLEANGLGDEAAASSRTAHRAALEASAGGAEGEELKAAVRGLLKAQLAQQFGQEPPESAVEGMLPGATAQLGSPWMRRFLAYDPAEDLARAQAPVLAVLGGRDLQVTDEAHAAPLADALARAEQAGSMVVVLPGKNHLFQEAATGTVSEYASAGAAPTADTVALIADWLGRALGE